MSIVQDLFTYAFRGSGKYILILGAVLSVVSDLASFAPLIGWIAVLILAGYFCAVYFQVILTSATGSGEAPEFPEVSNLTSDVLWPIMQVIVVVFFCLGPAMGYGLMVEESNFSGGVFFGLLGLGIVYFPMAMLAVVVLGYMGALSPHIVVSGIFRAGGLYWLGVFVLVLLYMAESFIIGLLEGHMIINSLVMAFFGMYILMTNGRILGVIYRERSEELDWV